MSTLSNFKGLASNKYVILSISNSGTTELKTLITPGFKGLDAKGLISEVAYKGITAAGIESTAADLTASIDSPYLNIEQFLFQVQNGGILINGLKVLVSGEFSGMIKNISFEKFRFNEPSNPNIMRLGLIINQNTNVEKVAEVVTNELLDKFTTTEMPIPAKSTVTVVFFIDGVRNDNLNIEYEIKEHLIRPSQPALTENPMTNIVESQYVDMGAVNFRPQGNNWLPTTPQARPIGSATATQQQSVLASKLYGR